METNLFIICANAFVAVLTLLSILALGMRGLTALFPERPAAGSDTARAAAIASAVSAIWPGARVTRIEEVKGDSAR